MNTIHAHRSTTSELVLPVDVELERRRPDGRHRTTGSTRPSGRRRGERTPVLALIVASGSAVLALVSIATDDVARTSQVPVAETTADLEEPRHVALLTVPAGVPCPQQPIRSVTPMPC